MTHIEEPNRQLGHLATPRSRGKLVVAAAVLGAFIVGAGGASVVARNRPITLVALAPAPINAMKDWSAVAIKGQVAEVFGNKFVVQDDSGRALVETGPAGESGHIVAPAETVTVQGRFEHGFVHAQAIAHADGRNDVVGPVGPGPRGGPPQSGRPGRPADAL